MKKLRLCLAVAAILLASVAWSRGQKTITIKPQPAATRGDAVVLHHLRMIVDHRDRNNTVYMRLEDVATLMQRTITYTLDEKGNPTGEITIQAPPKQRRK